MKENILSEALSNARILNQALFSRPKSLAKFLPYSEYLKNEQLYILKDNSLGCIYEIDLIEHEPLSATRIIEHVNSLKNWFNFPGNCVLQIFYEQNYISYHSQVWNQLSQAYKNSNQISDLLFKHKLRSLRDYQHLPFERKCYLSVRYFPPQPFIKMDKKDLLFRETNNFITHKKSFESLLKDLENNSFLKISRVPANELTDFLRKTFNPKTYFKREFAKYNDKLNLSDQVIYSPPTLNYDGINREGHQAKVLTLKTAPSYAYPGSMAYFNKLDFPFKLSLSFSFPSKRKTKNFYDLKEFLLDNAISARAKRQLKEIRETQNKLAHDDRCLFMTFNVILDSDNPDILEDRTRKIANIFNNHLECEVIEEVDIGLGLFLNSLPLNYSPQSDLSASRFVRILKSDAIKFIPIFDSFRGLQMPLQLYRSRENNLIKFNLLENETSNHTVVVADSGSGKSAFILDCIQSAKRLAPEPLVFVIDKKSSYKTMAKYYDADITIFESSTGVPFSPFRGIYDEQKINFLTHLLTSAIKLTSPKFEIESEHISAITKALKLAYAKKTSQSFLEFIDGKIKESANDEAIELTMEDFVAELASLTSLKEFEKMEKSIEQILHKLRPLYGDGIYAKHFQSSAKSSTKAKKLFYIYDLDALDSDPILQTLMTMAVIEEIRQTIKLPVHKGRGGFIVLEELGMLGRTNDTASKFIIDAAETFRKLGYWLVTLTPRPQNYFELEAGKAIWGVADNFVFLKMSNDNVDYLKGKSSLLDETNSQIIKSLETKKGEYAEVFYTNKNKTKQGAFRYFQSPYDRWLAPTNMIDENKIEQMFQRHNNDKWKVLESLANEE